MAAAAARQPPRVTDGKTNVWPRDVSHSPSPLDRLCRRARSSGARCAQARVGADLRGRLPTGPQGGVLSPLLSNLYLTEVDGMLERAKETTRQVHLHRVCTVCR